MKMRDLHHRGGVRSAGSLRPGSTVNRAGRPVTTAHSTSYLNTPMKEQLRAELEEAARNTASSPTSEAAE